MKRTFLCVSVCILLLAALALPALAAYPPVMDSYGLLTDDQHNDLQQRCLSLREEYGVDIAVCITGSLEGRSAEAYADDWYDSHNYSSDGILFLLAMTDRQWHISTTGAGIQVLTDYGLEQLEEAVIPCFSQGEYYEGFCRFTDQMSGYLSAWQAGTPVDVPGEGISLFLSLAIGAAVAGIGLLIMRSSMNTKNPQRTACTYLTEGSYRLHTNQDLFLYSNVSKIRRQQNNSSGGSSTHRSSSGTRHGGRGGSF